MGEPSQGDFEAWLCKKLTSLDIDNEVYGSYITSILDEDDDQQTKKETLEEILETITENNVALCKDVIEMYQSFKVANTAQANDDDKPNIDQILAAHVGVTTTTMQKQHQTQNSNEESKAIKRSVIAMYSSVDDEADTNELNENSSKPQHHQTVDSALEMFENTNAKNVSEVEKNTRLKQKEESAKKKEQDKV
uniref:Coiled-coil domain-containing protein 43 n=1 Tax=Ciona savignyi TaxID=51511 RepID=H2YX99_CIOSA